MSALPEVAAARLQPQEAQSQGAAAARPSEPWPRGTVVATSVLTQLGLRDAQGGATDRVARLRRLQVSVLDEIDALIHGRPAGEARILPPSEDGSTAPVADPLRALRRSAQSLLIEGEPGWALMALAAPPPVTSRDLTVALRRILIDPGGGPQLLQAAAGQPAAGIKSLSTARLEYAALVASTDVGPELAALSSVLLESALKQLGAMEVLGELSPLMLTSEAHGRMVGRTGRALEALLGEAGQDPEAPALHAALAEACVWGALSELHGGAPQPARALIVRSLRATRRVRRQARREEVPELTTLSALLAHHLRVDWAEAEALALKLRQPPELQLHVGPSQEGGLCATPGRGVAWKRMHSHVAVVLLATDAAADPRTRSWHQQPQRRVPDGALRAQGFLWRTRPDAPSSGRSRRWEWA